MPFPPKFLDLIKQMSAKIDKKLVHKWYPVAARHTAVVQRRERALSFLNDTILPALTAIGVSDKNAAVQLLGTAIMESDITFRKQLGGGPAGGLFQVEPNTHYDNWFNYLNYGSKPERALILALFPSITVPKYTARDHEMGKTSSQVSFDLAMKTLESELENNDIYCAIMAYIKYERRLNGAFADKNDFTKQAQNWKAIYNATGAGSAQKYLKKWHRDMGSYIFP